PAARAIGRPASTWAAPAGWPGRPGRPVIGERAADPVGHSPAEALAARRRAVSAARAAVRRPAGAGGPVLARPVAGRATVVAAAPVAALAVPEPAVPAVRVAVAALPARPVTAR